jgi:hypothetical protein
MQLIDEARPSLLVYWPVKCDHPSPRDRQPTNTFSIQPTSLRQEAAPIPHRTATMPVRESPCLALEVRNELPCRTRSQLKR